MLPSGDGKQLSVSRSRLERKRPSLYSAQWGKKDWNIGKRYLNKLARWNADGTQSEGLGWRRVGGREREGEKERQREREREKAERATAGATDEQRKRKKKRGEQARRVGGETLTREKRGGWIKVKSFRVIELEVTDRVASAPAATNLMQLLYNSLCRLALTADRTISEIELPLETFQAAPLSRRDFFR